MMGFCGNCGEKLKVGVEFCPKCGLKKGEVKTNLPLKKHEVQKRDNSKRILLALLILFWPAGLIYYFVKRATIKEIKENNWFLNHPFITWLIFFFIIGMLMSFIPSDNQNYSSTQNEPINKAKTVQKIYLDEDLNSILFKFVKSESSLTNLQKEELWTNEYKGQLVKGSVYAHSVDKNMFGTYVILADMAPRGPYDIGSDFAIFFKSSEKNKLIQISKGSKINFEGKLSAYHPIMGNLDISDAVIID